jgi:predicted nucleotidyltransferase
MEQPPIQKPQQEKKKLRTDKLIDATDLEGNKNELVFEVADKINKELLKFPEYIGVFPFGSQTKGYNEKGSDVDVFVFLERTNCDILDVLDDIKLKYKEKSISIDFHDKIFNGEDVRNIGYNDDRFEFDVSVLWQFGKGPKIEFWRDKIRNELWKRPAKEQNAYVTNTVEFLLRRDRMSFMKMSERPVKFDKKEYFKQRRELWEKRLIKRILQHEQK